MPILHWCMAVWRCLLFSTGWTESPCNCLHYRLNSQSQNSCLDPTAGDPTGFWFFFEQPFSLFLSFFISDFPPFDNASFPWISLSLHISTSVRFPLLGLSFMALSLSNPQSFVSHFTSLTSYSQSSRHFTSPMFNPLYCAENLLDLKEQEVT